MRLMNLAICLTLLSAVVVCAQPVSVVELGPVARIESVFIEGDARGATFVTGGLLAVNFAQKYGVEVEVTQAEGHIARSYEGWFVSYVPTANPTREETERWAPTARRTLTYSPGLGGSLGFVVRGAMTPRITVGARVGGSARRYVQTSTYTILSVPPGIDPARIARDFLDSSGHKTRGGLLAGIGGAFAVSPHVNVGAEARLVYGGPARIGNKHREVGVGLRAGWRF